MSENELAAEPERYGAAWAKEMGKWPKAELIRLLGEAWSRQSAARPAWLTELTEAPADAEAARWWEPVKDELTDNDRALLARYDAWQAAQQAAPSPDREPRLRLITCSICGDALVCPTCTTLLGEKRGKP